MEPQVLNQTSLQKMPPKAKVRKETTEIQRAQVITLCEEGENS